MEELKRVNLRKFVSEAVSYICEAKLCSAYIHAAVQICSLLHQRYKDFSPCLIQGLLRVFFPGESGDVLDSDKNSRAMRKRSTLKLLIELYFVGIVEDAITFRDIIKELMALEHLNDHETTQTNLSLLSSFAHQGKFSLDCNIGKTFVMSSSWAEHLQHVWVVFQKMREHKLALKKFTRFFGQESMTYLVHIVSAQGVAMDPSKVEAVERWLQPRTVHALCGFLGLMGYYRKFIEGCGIVAAPLTWLKKEAFAWSPDAEGEFQKLKTSFVTTPLLQLPDFNQRFIIECDASGVGFGAVLHQGTSPIAFYSKAVAPQHAKLAVYDRELIVLVKAVCHWRPYIWGHAFTVHTDHYSLKFILDQWLSKIPQHTWVSKLFGYDFIVEFYLGHQNVVVDALSHRDVSG